MKVLFYVLPLLAGVAISIQAGVNSQLRSALNNPILAAFVSFVTGTIALAIMVLFVRKNFPPLDVYRGIHLFTYTGGVLGVIVVTSIILAVPKIGATNMFVILIAAQLLTAVILDHYGLLGMKINPVSVQKVIGIGLLIAGAYLVNKK